MRRLKPEEYRKMRVDCFARIKTNSICAVGWQGSQRVFLVAEKQDTAFWGIELTEDVRMRILAGQSVQHLSQVQVRLDEKSPITIIC